MTYRGAIREVIAAAAYILKIESDTYNNIYL